MSIVGNLMDINVKAMSKKSKSNQDAEKQRKAFGKELIDDNFEGNVLESLKGRWAEKMRTWRRDKEYYMFTDIYKAIKEAKLCIKHPGYEII